MLAAEAAPIALEAGQTFAKNGGIKWVSIIIIVVIFLIFLCQIGCWVGVGCLCSHLSDCCGGGCCCGAKKGKGAAKGKTTGCCKGCGKCCQGVCPWC